MRAWIYGGVTGYSLCGIEVALETHDGSHWLWVGLFAANLIFDVLELRK